MGKLIYDADGNVVRTLITEDDSFDGTFHIETTQDVAPILEANKIARELQLDERFHTGKRETFTHVATVGVEVFERALREGWSDEDWDKFLNDSDNAAYRVWEGRV